MIICKHCVDLLSIRSYQPKQLVQFPSTVKLEIGNASIRMEIPALGRGKLDAGNLKGGFAIYSTKTRRSRQARSWRNIVQDPHRIPPWQTTPFRFQPSVFLSSHRANSSFRFAKEANPFDY